MSVTIVGKLVADMSNVMALTGLTCLGGLSPWDLWRTADGRLYYRSREHSEPSLFDDVNDDGPIPAAFCECGGDAFRLRNGNYELFGTCVDCGVEYSLYSG